METIIVLYAVVGVTFICTIVTTICFIIFMIGYKAKEKSTHVIEYRDPFKEYPDELSFEKDNNGNAKLNEVGKDYIVEEQDMDKVNEFLKNDEVII